MESNIFYSMISFMVYFGFCSLIDGIFTQSVNNLIANSTKQIITSPNYPDYYQSSMSVKWTIVADDSYTNGVVQIQVLDSYLEPSVACYFDSVSLINGPKSYSPNMYTWCGASYPTSVITSETNTVQLLFESNAYVNNYRGFKLEYWAIARPYSWVGTVEFTWLHYTLFGLSGCILFVFAVILIFIACARKRKQIIHSKL